MFKTSFVNFESYFTVLLGQLRGTRKWYCSHFYFCLINQNGNITSFLFLFIENFKEDQQVRNSPPPKKM